MFPLIKRSNADLGANYAWSTNALTNSMANLAMNQHIIPESNRGNGQMKKTNDLQQQNVSVPPPIKLDHNRAKRRIDSDDVDHELEQPPLCRRKLFMDSMNI